MPGNALSAALIATLILSGTANAQPIQPASEKPVLTQVIRDLQTQFEALRDSRPARRNLESYQLAINRLRWFSKSVEVWHPQATDEAKGLRQSMQLMLAAVRRNGDDSGPSVDLIQAVTDDLGIKRDHCRLKGLSALQDVAVRTKRRGKEEVAGLEVWYLEKFLASDPTASPHRFRKFSSPATESMVPGRYSFWARDSASGKAAMRVEQRVGAGQPTLLARPAQVTEIEVLAP